VRHPFTDFIQERDILRLFPRVVVPFREAHVHVLEFAGGEVRGEAREGLVVRYEEGEAVQGGDGVVEDGVGYGYAVVGR